MKRLFSVLALVLVLVNASCTKDDSTMAVLVEKAYVYTLPLMMMDATEVKMTNTVEPTNMQAPSNRLIHAANLATHESKDVVTPNVDTYYSQIYMDLSQDALVVELPATERYCMAQILDAWTNCLSCVHATDFQADYGLICITGPSFAGNVPSEMIHVKCPTSLAWMIVRTLSNGISENDPQIAAIQSKMKTYTLTGYLDGQKTCDNKGTFNPENNYVPVRKVLTMTPEEYFRKANELMVANPPAEADKEILAELKKINVGPGLEFNIAVLPENVREGWTGMVSDIINICLKKSASFIKFNGHWSYYSKPIAEFGTEYYYRSLIAVAGLGANPVSQAIYPKTEVDVDSLRLNGQNCYVLHFDAGQLPETEEHGFWSITLYDESNFLVENPIGRYCINDRDELVFNEDGSLDIFIQHEPYEGCMANWLPAPAEDFHLHLRVYKPTERVLSNAWPMPQVKRR